MTRKHMKAIAEVINAIDDKDVRAQVALNMATTISQFNPRFDVARFVSACVA